jgi:hypothetical protein
MLCSFALLQVRQGKQPPEIGQAQLNPSPAEEDLLHAEAAHRLPDAGASTDGSNGDTICVDRVRFRCCKR